MKFIVVWNTIESYIIKKIMYVCVLCEQVAEHGQ